MSLYFKKKEIRSNTYRTKIYRLHYFIQSLSVHVMTKYHKGLLNFLHFTQRIHEDL